MDRAVYDRGWFPYTLISKPIQTTGGEEENILSEQFNYLNYKVVYIDDRGFVQERMSFVHPFKSQNDQHLYFFNNFTKMVEILINRQRRHFKPTYNVYEMPIPGSERWNFVEALDEEKEWHTKTFFPYNLNQDTLELLQDQNLGEDTLYKCLPNNRVKVLNVKDGIEMIVDLESGKIQSYMALMYQFQTTQDSFYDKKSGQQFIQDITERLQNYYENQRRRVFLKGKWQLNTSTVDITARNFKNKFVIE